MPVAGVEPSGQVAGQFYVLALVLPHGDLVGVIQQDVGGHQDRVGQQRHPDLLLASGLLPELDHALGLAVTGEALQQVVQLGVFGNVGLDREQAGIGVQACGRGSGTP